MSNGPSEADKDAFRKELQKIYGDFNDWSSHVRTKSMQFMLSMIVVNWAVFSKVLGDSETLFTILKENVAVKKSVTFAVVGISVMLVSSFFYTIHLKWRGHTLQADFRGSRRLFKARENSDSTYPYWGWASVVILVVDLVTICFLIASVYQFTEAISFSSAGG